MTLRILAGLGALLSPFFGAAPRSRTSAGVGEHLATQLCLTLSGLALPLVMGMPGRVAAGAVSAIQTERGNYL